MKSWGKAKPKIFAKNLEKNIYKVFARRHIVKNLREKCGVDKLTPGITGWAQVNGRDFNSFEKKVKLDHYYMLNKSFLLDIQIILMTIKVVLLPKEVKH